MTLSHHEVRGHTPKIRPSGGGIVTYQEKDHHGVESNLLLSSQIGKE